MYSKRSVSVGGLSIGGESPVVVQTMTNTNTEDITATLGQIERLADAGCELVRVAVPNLGAAEALKEICRRSPLPVAADIHFDYRLALKAIDAGVQKLRLNPGNIGDPKKVREVVKAAKEHSVPIRIGVNSGSVAPKWQKALPNDPAAALVESASEHVAILENEGFYDIVLSLKSSDVITTVNAYRIASKRFPYPLHLGITEAGTTRRGTIKSAVGIGALLLDGIGDTIRVSLTADPVEEVWVAFQILAACGLRRRGPEIISCPTCGRTEIDVMNLAEEVDKRLQHITTPMTIAVMGCIVNGPGEAKHADFGIAGGRGTAMLFRKGKQIKRLSEKEIVDTLVEEAERFEAMEGLK